jgi:hypothetical protein
VDADEDVDGVGAEEEAEVSLNSGGAIYPSAYIPLPGHGHQQFGHTFGVAWILVINLAYYLSVFSHCDRGRIQSKPTYLAVPIVVRQQLLSSFFVQCTLGIRVDQQALYCLTISSHPI